jgi:hypothetical protein
MIHCPPHRNLHFCDLRSSAFISGHFQISVAHTIPPKSQAEADHCRRFVHPDSRTLGRKKRIDRLTVDANPKNRNSLRCHILQQLKKPPPFRCLPNFPGERSRVLPAQDL